MDKLIRYRIFQPFEKLEAFTTTKQSIKKDAVRFTGDDVSMYKDSREQLAALLGIEHNQLIFPRQTHSDKVCKLDHIPASEISDTDALITSQPGLCLCVQTADCVPVLLFDPVKNVVAAVHAGWRGTVSKIVAKAVSKMKESYNCSESDILAAIGPSIGPGVYEVGDEVVEAARASVPNAEHTLYKKESGKYHFDLWEANRLILLECGLPKQHIEVLSECSFEEDKKYYSARRDGATTGRMVSGIMLRV